MTKRNELNKSCNPAMMLCHFVLLSVLLQVAFSSDLYGDDNHPPQLPLAFNPAGFWTFVSDTKPPGGVFLFSRLGRKFWKLPQTLIPYPRAGRMLTDEEYDILMPENGYDYPFADNNILDSKQAEEKRLHPSMNPRIGRKKRSVDEPIRVNPEMARPTEESIRLNPLKKRSIDESNLNKNWVEDLDDLEDDYFSRQDRSRSRITFVPRVGKKSTDDLKRALAFTPRIGRASLIPRIGRNDQRFKVKSRGSFIPRIGRRAALIPRIGRSSEESQMDSEEAD